MAEDSAHAHNRPIGSRPKARATRSFYRRTLPHFQGHGRALFVTFATYERWVLPDEARRITLRHCVHDHGRKMELYCAVVMPDHVHLLYPPFGDAEGTLYGLSEIVGAIKSVSAHAIAVLLGRRESVWQEESYGHVMRMIEDIPATADYICNNPVRKGLCKTWEEYPFLWRQWTDGQIPGDTTR